MKAADLLRQTEAMFDEVEDYLTSSAVFWPLASHPPAGAPPYPRLSLGGLLTALAELRARAGELSEAEQRALQDLEQAWQKLSQRRSAALRQKALAEARQRVNLWRAYLQDLEEGQASVDDYAQAAYHRTALDSLRPLLEDSPEGRAMLEEAARFDSRLRQRWRPGRFIGPESAAPAHPHDRHWWLYGQPSP